MPDIIVDFLEDFVIVIAKSDKGLEYLKTHWTKRPLCNKKKFVKRWKIESFRQAQLLWAVLSNCESMRDKQLWRQHE